MKPAQMLFEGISPDHYPAVIALLLLPPVVSLGLWWLRGRPPGDRWDARLSERWRCASFARRMLAILLLTTAVAHLALPLGHRDAPVLALMFLASGSAFAVLAVRSLGNGRWHGQAVLLLAGNIVAYLVVAGSGWQEEADQIGVATKLVELLALALIIMPTRSRVPVGFWRRLARPAASAAIVALTFVTGAVIWVGSFVGHTHAEAVALQAATGGVWTGHAEHAFGARAQAGVIVRPGSGAAPTAAQSAAALRLLETTRAAASRFADYRAALAAGYRSDGFQGGLVLHLTNKSYQHDGHTLDPQRPEQLVFAAQGQRKLLLGVVYQMERADEPGPAVGGPITSWHAHNICLALTPPSFGIVSPFGTCPIGGMALTSSEMMHVWVVDNPAGPFASDIDRDRVRQLLRGGQAQARP